MDSSGKNMGNLWMRKWIGTSLVIYAALLVAGGVRADDDPQVTLSVKEDVTRSRSKETKGDVNKWPHFSIYREATTKNCTLDITVSSQGEKDVPCQLEWYFISEKAALKESVRLIDKSKSHSITETTLFNETSPDPTAVRAGKNKIILQRGKPLEKTAKASFTYARIAVDEFEIYGSQDIKMAEYFEGDTYVGYIVLVTVDGNVIARAASNTWLLTDKWAKRCQDIRH